MSDDRIQHGIDNDPNNDAKKGATIGGVGGAVVGAMAGSVVGPLGTIAGAVVGGLVGGVASGAAVHEVDKIDNDSTISGLGHHEARDLGDSVASVTPGNGIPGIQTGGHDIDGTPDTRGITEKVEDAVTGDRIDDKTGKPVR